LRLRYVLLATAALAGLVLAPWWLSALGVNLGRIELGRGQLAGAIARAEEAIAWRDDNPRAHLLLGEALRRQGQGAQALAALERAVVLDPGNATARYQLAEALYHGGEAEAAIPHWRAAGAAPALNSRAQAARAAKDLPGAVRWFDLATRVDPSLHAAWLGLAQSLGTLGRWEESATVYGLMIDRFPHSRFGYEGRADLLWNRLKDRPGALVTVEAGLEAVSESPAQLRYLRSTYRANGNPADLPGAEEDARVAIALAPSNGWYRSWLGDLFLRQQRYAEALAEYAAIPAAATSDPSWTWRSRQKAGAVWAAQQEWERAIEEYAAAVSDSAAQGVAATALASNHAQMGSVLAQAGRTGEAIAAYEAAIAHDPANTSYPKTLEGLRKPKK
jgi:tetratricopeptide (TPR) repeat protein